MSDAKTRGVSRLYLDGLLFFTLSIPAFLLTAQSWLLLTLDWQWKNVLSSDGISFLAGLQFFLIGGMFLLLAFWYVAFWCLLMRDVCREIAPQGGWNLKPNSVWWVFLPVLGVFFAIGILVDLSLRRSHAAMTMLAVHLASLAAIPLIFICLPIHKVNLNLILLLFIISTASAICHYSLLANKRPSKLGYLLAWPLLGVILLNVAFAYYSMYSLDSRVERADAVLAALGVPTSREKAKEFYYQGIRPDQYFTNMSENMPGKQLFPDERAKLGKIDNYKYFTYTDTEKKQRKDFISSSEAFFAAVNKLGESDKPLKVERDYNQPLCHVLLPNLTLSREAARSYSLRISEAVDEKDKAEVMRLFKLASVVLSNIDDDSSLVGGLTGVACDNIMLDTLEHMLSASILTDSDLAEIDSILRRREDGMKFHIRRALLSETYFCIDTFDTFLEGGFNDDESMPLDFRLPQLRNIPGVLIYSHAAKKRIFLAEFSAHNLKISSVPEEYYLKKNLFKEWKTNLGFKERFPLGVFFNLIIPDHKCYYERFVSLEARLRMAQIALKIEQFKLKNNGRLPGSLAELSAELPRDPFSGNDFKYEHGRLTVQIGDAKKTQKEVSCLGYRLSGTGPNLKHDSCFTVGNGQ